MDFFEIDKEVDPSSLHFKFNILSNEIGYLGAKKILSRWGEDFFDRDKKAKKEFQTTFHSTLWEIYLHAALKDMGFNVCTKHKRPDFIVKSPSEFYVEAVTSEIKKGGDSEELRTPEDVYKNLHPLATKEEFSQIIDEAITRHSNSLESKIKKYRGFEHKGKHVKGYIECNWISQERPYIIAVSSHDQISYGREFIYSMFALLYGKYYDPESGKYIVKTHINKPGTDTNIKLGLFSDTSTIEVSAILFCNTLTLGKLASLHKSENLCSDTILNIRTFQREPYFRVHEVTPDNPETLLDGLYVFHNPNAANKLDFEIFEDLAQFSEDEGGVYQIGNHPLIVARYHTNILPSALIPQLKAEIFENYNPEYCAKKLKKNPKTPRSHKGSSTRPSKKQSRKIAKASRRRNR
jgi:hypothetical protein